jgi:transmembrane sensor
MAAIAAAAALTASVGGEKPDQTRGWTLIQVAFGHIRSMDLGDGRTVHLNTDSRIHVQLGDAQTLVAIDQGEAMFTGRSSRELRVAVNGNVVTTRNAEFSVRVRDRGRTDIIVAQGTVDAGHSARVLADWAERLLPVAAGTKRLVAGETASIDAGGLYGKRTLSSATLRHKLAWTDNWLWFSDETLAEAVERFNSYNAEQLIIADPRLSSMTLGGRFRPTEPESFVASLQRVFDVSAVRSSAAHSTAPRVYLTVRCNRNLRRCDTAMVQ